MDAPLRRRGRSSARTGLGLAALLGASCPAWSQAPRPTERTIERDVPAIRLATPPVIDGDLTDPVWQQAGRADRWVDWLNGNAQIDQTVVFVGYDEENLYLAWYAYDSRPGEIVARQTKRGAFPAGDDWVDLNIDPYHTHKFSDFSFFYLNPRGAKFARLAGGRATKLEWDLWRLAGGGADRLRRLDGGDGDLLVDPELSRCEGAGHDRHQLSPLSQAGEHDFQLVEYRPQRPAPGVYRPPDRGGAAALPPAAFAPPLCLARLARAVGCGTALGSGRAPA